MLGGGEDTVFTLPGQQLVEVFSLAEPDGLGFFPAVGIRSYARCLTFSFAFSSTPEGRASVLRGREPWAARP